MLELNKQYEARFLGCQVLKKAVTSELLSRLVQGLPDVLHSGLRCKVLCNATGLTVARPTNAAGVATIANGEENGNDVTNTLKVALQDILFCHVDKSRPEVTVWVVRNNKGAARTEGSVSWSIPRVNGARMPTVAEEGSTLHAYIYRCANAHDALGLFKVYNEMNRQSKLEKYRRNGEKREVDAPSTSGSESSLDSQQSLLAATVPNNAARLESTVEDDSASSASSSAEREAADGATIEASPTHPSVTVISGNTSARATVRTSGDDPKIAAKLWGQPQKVQPDLRNALVINGLQPPLNTNSGAVNGRPGKTVTHRAEKSGTDQNPSWASIVGSIEHYRRSFSTLRPRDKEVRAAMLAELREKLKSRSGVAPTSGHDFSDSKDAAEQSSSSAHSRQLASNRQRKPAKTLNGDSSSDSSDKKLFSPTSGGGGNNNFRSPVVGVLPSGVAVKALPFPWSMTNMVKKLVHNKNRHNCSGGYVIGSVNHPQQHQQGPAIVTPMLMVPIKGHLGVSMPLTPSNGHHQHGPSRKFKAKKGPAPAPPIPALIKSRMATNGDPFFYLPPIPHGSSPSNSSSDSGSPTNGAGNRGEVFVPVLPPAWIHHNHNHIHVHQHNVHNNNQRTKLASDPSGTPVSSGNNKTRSKGTTGAEGQIGNGDGSGKRVVIAYHHQPHTLAKKKTHVMHGLGRLTRGYKKRATQTPPPPLLLSAASGSQQHRLAAAGNFVRTSSMASRGSSSSDSGAEGGKLRSVMKKPKPTSDDSSPPEQKKNVTFHAYATVQVLP